MSLPPGAVWVPLCLPLVGSLWPRVDNRCCLPPVDVPRAATCLPAEVSCLGLLLVPFSHVQSPQCWVVSGMCTVSSVSQVSHGRRGDGVQTVENFQVAREVVIARNSWQFQIARHEWCLSKLTEAGKTSFALRWLLLHVT